jgi:hypothetical protein
VPKPLPLEIKSIVRFLADGYDDAAAEADRNADFFTLHYYARGRAEGCRNALIYLAGYFGYGDDCTPTEAVARLRGDCLR